MAHARTVSLISDLKIRYSSTTAVVTGKGWGDYAVSRQNSKWLSYARYGNVRTDTKCKQTRTTGLVFPSRFHSKKMTDSHFWIF